MGRKPKFTILSRLFDFYISLTAFNMCLDKGDFQYYKKYKIHVFINSYHTFVYVKNLPVPAKRQPQTTLNHISKENQFTFLMKHLKSFFLIIRTNHKGSSEGRLCRALQPLILANSSSFNYRRPPPRHLPLLPLYHSSTGSGCHATTA